MGAGVGRTAMPEEHNADENEDSSGSFNRRSFVKALGGAGGAAVTGGLFASRAQAATPLQTSSKNKESITGDKLNQLTRKVMKQTDVRNVMDETTRETVQNGTSVQVSSHSSTDESVNLESIHTTKANNPTNLGKDDAVVSAVRHTLENGNKMTAMTYATGGGQAIMYYEYDNKENGIESRAKLMSFETGRDAGDGNLIVEKSSTNGELSKSLSTFANCPGCEPGPGAGGSRQTRDCDRYNIYCLGSCCGTCGVFGGCYPCVIACITTWCIGCMGNCCKNYGTTCVTC